MAQLIELKLVSEAGTPVAWPGTTELVQVNLVDDVDAVWIGVSEDGLTNQSYPVSTPIATVLAAWPRAFQGIQAVISGQTNIYNNGLLDYERRVAACCISPQSETSPSASPGESPGPQSIQMMFTFSFTQLGGCEEPQNPFYVAADADPDNMSGQAIFNDPELTDPIDQSGQYVIVNGIVYAWGGGEETNVIGELIGACADMAQIMFTVDFDTPGQEATFQLISNNTMQFFVDWGDGSPVQEYNGDDVTADHIYADAGQYPVKVNFGVITTPFHTLVIINVPLAAFGFHPEYGNSIAIQTLQLENCGLTDATVDWASFVTANMSSLIMPNNQLTSASLPQMTEFISTLNLNGNNLGDIVLTDGPEQLAQLFASNAGVDSFDGSDFVTSSLSVLDLSGNNLEAFNAGEQNWFNLATLNLSQNSLPSTDVDAILQALDAQGLEGGTVDLFGQTPAAPPSGAGTVAQGSLESKSWTVTVDS